MVKVPLDLWLGSVLTRFGGGLKGNQREHQRKNRPFVWGGVGKSGMFFLFRTWFEGKPKRQTNHLWGPSSLTHTPCLDHMPQCSQRLAPQIPRAVEPTVDGRNPLRHHLKNHGVMLPHTNQRGFLWFPMVSYGFLWFPMVSKWCNWISQPPAVQTSGSPKGTALVNMGLPLRGACSIRFEYQPDEKRRDMSPKR